MLSILEYIKFYTKTVPLAVWLLFIFACATLPAQAQVKLPNKTKLQKPAKDTTVKAKDTYINTTTLADTNSKDTTAKFVDTLNIPISKSALSSQVKYNAKDSIIYDIAVKKVYLYGKAHIDYQDLTLDASFITIDWTTNEITAEGLPDSSGKITGTPVFKQGDQNFTSKKLTYNFKTKRGRINELLTKEGEEGYIHSKTVKTVKQPDGKDVIFAKNAKYTTCDLADPHYYIQTNKLKLIPKDKVITGPALIYIEKVPIPLVLPFGFFPANSRKSSGIIIPSVGNAGSRGFVVRNGGFYYGGSDYFDLALTGDIYTGGSYKLSTQTNYAKRYRFDGGITLEYARLDNGRPKETPDYDVNEYYNIAWQHMQNPKAHPGTNFNANVNIASSKFLKQTSYNANAIRQQNLNSSVSYSKQFRGTPFNISTALTHSQVLSTGEMDFTLPNVNLSMNRINPFKSKNAIQKRWYHDIGLGFNLNAQNQLQTTDKTLRKDLQWNKFNNGAHFSAPLSTSFKVFKFFSLSPSLNYDSYFYTKRSFRTYNTTLEKVDTINQNGFYFTQAWSANTSLSTLLYGMYQINRGRLIALRHTVTPTITMSYRPDYGLSKYGIYRTVQTDPAAKVFSTYSIYEASGSIAGYPSLGKQGKMFFSIGNNVELKMKTKKDTTESTKKIKIFEFLNLNGGYNFLADSFNLDPFSFSASTTLFEKLRINGGAALNPYKLNYTPGGRGYMVDTFMFKNSHSLGRITNANLSLSTDLNAEARKDAGRVGNYNNPYIGYYYAQPYANFDIPWSLGFSYNLYYSKPFKETTVTQTVQLNSSLSITKNWQIAVRGDYDIRKNNISFAQFDIRRDLHCWEMSFQWIPFGTYQSYFFNIHIKASTLRDVKLDKRRDFYQFD